MRILNDKEIEDVLGCWCGQMHEYKAVAKAQHQQDLKDFIEVLEAYKFYEDFGGDSAKGFRDRVVKTLNQLVGL